MNIRKHTRVLAVVGLVMPMMLPSTVVDASQRFLERKQIIHQLQRAPKQPNVSQQRVERPRLRRRAPQPGNAPVATFRAPAPNEGPSVRRRAPQPHQGNVATMRAPGTNGQLRSRPPQPETAFARPPQPETAFARPPQPQNGGVEQFRAPPPRADNRPQRRVASTSSRGLDVQPVVREQQFSTATRYPNNGRVDLEILFDYDSDRIDPGSVRQLIELGDALNDPSLRGSRIVIAGHTDATGGNRYNLDLSFRRARAVTEFLVNYAGIDPSRLNSEGFGEDLLKFPDAPASGQNRRVEIINLGEAG